MTSTVAIENEKPLNIDEALSELSQIQKSLGIDDEAESVRVEAEKAKKAEDEKNKDLPTNFVKPSEKDPKGGPVSKAMQLIEKAQWSTKFMDDLPDSSFLHIEAGGKKDEDGKTTPRSLRHFPVKDASGKADLPHVRNAIAQAPKADLPDAVKEKVQSKAKAMLADLEKKIEKVLVEKGADYYEHVALLRAACLMMEGCIGMICENAEVTPVVAESVNHVISMLETISTGEDDVEKRGGVTKSIGRTLNRVADSSDDGWPSDLNSSAFLGDAARPRRDAPSFGKDGDKPPKF